MYRINPSLCLDFCSHYVTFRENKLLDSCQVRLFEFIRTTVRTISESFDFNPMRTCSHVFSPPTIVRIEATEAAAAKKNRKRHL